MDVKSLLIGVVGPCSSGKSTLAGILRQKHYRVKEIMQEHCSAPDMWLRITHPDILVYLDVDEDVAAAREGIDKASSWWKEEREVRLAHARAHCDVYVDTSSMTPQEVAARVQIYLDNHQRT
ncbi:MAG: hypothetical protein P1S60_16365 [Anaerolineae bacterium]|nr:hypothetical protein [Anaerolineae bacterium]